MMASLDLCTFVFWLTTLATFAFFMIVLKNAGEETVKRNTLKIASLLMLWLILQAILTIQNVYSNDINSLPPKILIFGILPPVLTICILFITKGGRKFIDSLPLKQITYLHMIRIPVEIVLYGLFISKMIPELMTFEGRNFDIIAGITAPLIAYYGFSRKMLSRKIILIWNFICLGLLINIIVNAFLSAPSPLQKFAFDQPNIAILHFPFSWLPTFIVPIVLFGHLVAIRQLLKKQPL
ncbi:hypothetical protein [Pedobacter montanisoli]|uniref:TIGR02206 family membrane protein n=1 Tax=Pedobacter montanisoli TaxID=2923277 RepID=A0ABS9ZSL3_9SPHI|nr:hypothetical protein [Pedobacter montanisoli]MCJ0741580.1 hypothetical protein [Pedobacter montanisoli]